MLPNISAPATEPSHVAEQPLPPDAKTSQIVAAPSPASSTSTATALAPPAAPATPAPGVTEHGVEAHPRPSPGCTAGSDSTECKENASPPNTSGSHAPPAGQANEVWSGQVKPGPTATAPPSERAQTAQAPARRIAKAHAPKQHLASAASNRAIRRTPERAEARGPASSPLAAAKQTWHTVLSEIEPRERVQPTRSTEVSETHTAIYRGH
jgi:hypothetical protein